MRSITTPAPGLIAAFAWLFALLPVTGLLADGWHNAALSTGSLDDWMNQLKRSVPDLDQRLSKVKDGTGTASLQSGRGIDALRQKARQLDGQANTSPASQPTRINRTGRIGADMTRDQMVSARLANDCLEVLQYMNRDNIIPQEFPTFQLEKMPEYKKAAQQILRAIGPEGTSAAVQRVRSDLMARFNNGLKTNPDYYDQLFNVLDAGLKDMNKDDFVSLNNAASGKKIGVQAKLAKRVNDWLSDAKNVDLPTLLEWIKDEDDQVRKKSLLGKVRKQLSDASLGEIAMALDVAKETSDTIHRGMIIEIGRRIPKATVLDLLMMMEVDADQKLTAAATRQLAEKSPRYSEAKEDLAAIWTFVDSNNKAVADGARQQVENAFLRAPISECLAWLNKVDSEQEQFLWKQIEAKVKRADASRKATYRQVGLLIVLDEEKRYSVAQRSDAIEFLRRLGDRQALGEVIDHLTDLPQELWPSVGTMLRELTGQSFGPRRGDKVIDVFAAKKEWQRWWRANGG